MQSKNILWFGLLFVLLLTTFCISKYIDEFHPNIKTVVAPKEDILAKDFELELIVANKIPKEIKTDKIDEKYLKAIELVEQQERDIQEAYDKALKAETEKKIKKTTPHIKRIVKVKPDKKITKQILIKKKKRQKIAIETVLESQTLLQNQEEKLSNFEKDRLKKLVDNLYQNPSSFLRIEIDKKNKKFYRVKKYLAILGINIKNIEILNDKYNKKIYISKANYNDIEISVIKKD